jgi:hypothetical protein
MKTISRNPTTVVFPDLTKGATTRRKVSSISEFIKPRLDLNASCQTLDTVATADTAATDASDITDAQTAATDASAITDAQAHVQFSKQLQVARIMHLAEYTQEEMEATWYQEEEYTRISKICIKTVHKMEKRRKRSLRKREVESRGLEGHTTTGTISKKESRRLAYDKIFHEQEHQRFRGIYNDEAMAESYQTVSSSCALWARTLALRDQIDAEDYCPVKGV